MSKRKYSEVEMIGALKQMEAGRSAAEVGRELGVSKHTVYAWKAKYGGMSVGEAQRLRQLEDENGRLKKLVADLSLDKDILKAVIEKKTRVELVERKAEVRWLWGKYLVSQRRIRRTRIDLASADCLVWHRARALLLPPNPATASGPWHCW